MVGAVAFLFVVYVVAAVPYGLAITTWFGDDADIRREGSGNIGATNVARVHGWRLAVPVLAIDMAKGLVPVLLADAGWPHGGMPWLSVVGVVAFVGHCYPVFLAFHGGKGVATSAGVMLGLAPVETSLAVATWALLLLVTRRSSAASLGATAVLVGAMTWWRLDALPAALLLGVGVVQRHVPNIRRLVAGDEAAILRPVRWGGAATATEDDAAAALSVGPAGEAGRAPDLWDPEPTGEAPWPDDDEASRLEEKST